MCAIAICAVSMAGSARAQTAPARDADVTAARADLNGVIQTLTGSGEVALEQVRTLDGWHTEPASTANYGFSNEAHWFRLRLRNPTAKALDRYVELAYPPLDRVDFYAIAPDGAIATFETGDALPFSHRPLPRHTFVFPVEVPAASTVEVYVRVRTESSVQVPFHVWSPTAFLHHTYNTQMWLGLFYGVMAIMILYNLFVFASVRDPSYLFFCLFATGFMGIQSGLDGLSYQYLWPSAPGLNALAMPIFIAGGTALGVQFSRMFLQLPTRMPRWDRAMRIIIVVGATLTAAALILPYSIAVRASSAYAAVATMALMVAGPVALRQGFRSARFFVLAWGVFLVGSIALIMGKFGLLPATIVTLRGPQIGASLEVLFLSLALADRINILQDEARAAQLEALAAQRRATEMLQEEVDARTVELRHQADQLRTLDTQKTRFFQNVSHELRTPLTLILASSEELRQTETLAQDDRFGLIDKNARRLLRLVNELLDFQKLEAGRKTLSRAPIDLVPFLASCADYVRPACEARGIEFVLDTSAAGKRVVVEADADALEKVAFNYLSNALKHTPDGGRIALTLTEETETGVAEIAVEDSGRGIAEQDRTRLFQVFSQLDDEKARKAGSGLGLALVRELVQAHGGEVGLDSEVDHGSRFWARLPTTDDDHSSLATVALSQWELEHRIEDDPSISITTDAGASSTMGDVILVVDDLPDMRGLVRRALYRNGHETIGASNGARALEIAKRVRPALIVTDWMMPELTGPELIEQIRDDAELAGTPIVLLTAKTDEESRTSGVHVGADAFLGKPFDELELASIVRNLLALKSRERELERAQHQKEELTRFVVHDLKNPLTIIAANVELLLDDEDLTDDARESLASVQLATESTHRMVLNLLDISRSEDGQLVPSAERFEVAALAAELAGRMALWLERKRQPLRIDVRTDELVADRALVARLLENLIANASKHGPDGEPITVEIDREGYVGVLRVCDRGPGVPAHLRDRVFEKYAQVDRERAAPGSHGLGLVFCRMVAEAHGGTIGVDDNEPSEDGSRTGACFWVRLPLREPRKQTGQRKPNWPAQVQPARPNE